MCCIFKHLSELVRHRALKMQTFKKAAFTRRVSPHPDGGPTPWGWTHELSTTTDTSSDLEGLCAGLDAVVGIVRERQRPTSQQLIHQSDKQRVKERMAAAASEPVEKPDRHIWWIHKASTWAAVLAGQHEGHRVGLLAKKLLSVPVFKDPQSKHTTTKKLLSLSVLFLYSCLCWKKMVSSCITTNWSEHKICFVFIFPARLLFFLL